MQVYKVGGNVRDKLLNLKSKDIDYVVVGASVQQMLDLGYRAVGKDFPVFLHPKTHEEYALARTEKKIAKGYQGFSFYADPSISLEQDLYRRDLTINAIAEDENGHLIDPYNGQKDIKDKLLRHVSPAFKEDPVRILRIARFAARFHSLGFIVANETMLLMQEMVSQGEVDALISERVWQEIERALGENNPEIFFDVLKTCGALNILLPEINNLYGVPQAEKWHPEIDTGLHTMMVLQQATQLSLKHDLKKQDSISIRFASLVHDLGKALTPKNEWPSHKKHEFRGIAVVQKLCDRLKVSKQQRELALLVTEYHLFYHRISELKAKTIIKLFNNLDAFRRTERFSQFLLACEADSRGRQGFEDIIPAQTAIFQSYFDIAYEINVKDIVSKGYVGKAITEQLNQERVLAISRSKE